MHSNSYDTPPAQRQASENSLNSLQVPTQRSSRFCSHIEQAAAVLKAICTSTPSILLSLTILGLATLYSGGTLDVQAGEGNRLRIEGNGPVLLEKKERALRLQAD